MNNRAFSLIEILVVIVIISILGTLVAVNLVNKPAEARITACKANIKTLQTALQMYKTDQSKYPTQAQSLLALVQKPALPPLPRAYPKGGYLEQPVLPKDPWNYDFIYLIPGRKGEKYEIISYGADGEPGGEDEDADLSSSSI